MKGGFLFLILQTYYDILGIPQTADNEQIKSAFRRLAKLYHPDKNPKGKDEFGKILMAYEVLINSAQRSQYDLRLKRGAAMGYNEKESNFKKQKEWTFNEEELKRRQYYREHYKKEYERHSTAINTPRKTYNEYKYILFAAPIAVGLLLFIVNVYEQHKTGEAKKEDITITQKIDYLKMTDDPFTAYFKNPVYDIKANWSLVIKNSSTMDMVVAIFDEKNKFLRSSVIKSGFYIEVSQLPAKEMNIRFNVGKHWSRSKEHKGISVIGGFTEKENFHILNTRETNGYSITLDDSTINVLDEISRQDFFKRN